MTISKIKLNTGNTGSKISGTRLQSSKEKQSKKYYYLRYKLISP